METSDLQQLLQCPDCQGRLEFDSRVSLAARCGSCGFQSLERDLRPQHPKPRSLPVPVTLDVTKALQETAVGIPDITCYGTKTPRNSADVISLLQREIKTKPALLLDLGCGRGEYRPLLKALGCQYLGVDVIPEGPDLQADAHALPFPSHTFDAVFSVAVLEHVHILFLALAEAYRVLKPGGPLVGVAAFGEPFHDSFFHASVWGLASALGSQGFVIERLWSSRDALRAYAVMGGYPRIVRWLLCAGWLCSRLPFLSPRRWLRTEARPLEALTTAGSIGFCARKPLVPSAT